MPGVLQVRKEALGAEGGKSPAMQTHWGDGGVEEGMEELRCCLRGRGRWSTWRESSARDGEGKKRVRRGK